MAKQVVVEQAVLPQVPPSQAKDPRACPCTVDELGTECVVMFTIDPIVWKRMKGRMETAHAVSGEEQAKYLWERILRRALESHVY